MTRAYNVAALQKERATSQVRPNFVEASHQISVYSIVYMMDNRVGVIIRALERMIYISWFLVLCSRGLLMSTIVCLW